MSLNEAQIIEAARRGKQQGYHAIAKTYGQTVFSLISRFVPNLLDAEELTQDAFIRAFQNIAEYDEQKSSLSTWLYRIAYHLAIDWLRRQRPAMVSIEDLKHIDDNEKEEQWVIEESDHEELLTRMLNAIDTLPPEEQAIIAMFHFENRSLSDIAYITGMQKGTIATRLHRIRKKLYTMMK